MTKNDKKGTNITITFLLGPYLGDLELGQKVKRNLYPTNYSVRFNPI